MSEHKAWAIIRTLILGIASIMFRISFETGLSATGQLVFDLAGCGLIGFILFINDALKSED